MEEKLKELMADTSFCEELEKTSSPEEASALFAQHGIQITPEELLAAVEQPEGELDETALDDVAGGCWGCTILKKIAEIIGGPISPRRPKSPWGRRW